MSRHASNRQSARKLACTHAKSRGFICFDDTQLTKELIQVVLDWSAGQQNATLTVEGKQRCDGLAPLSSLQPARKTQKVC